MIKRFFIIAILSSFCSIVSAADMLQIPYKNLQEGAKIAVINDGDTWTAVYNKKYSNYYIKRVSEGSGSYSEFYSPDGSFVFSTGCQYEFLKNGSLIGYSNPDLKFYEFSMKDKVLARRELTVEEIEALFPDFKIIKISDFTTSTNSLKVKKSAKKFKVILLNDTDRYFYKYGFTSNNAEFKTYSLNGFLNITKKGMIQFSHFGDNTKNNPWFMLLVR